MKLRFQSENQGVRAVNNPRNEGDKRLAFVIFAWSLVGPVRRCVFQ